MKKSVFIAIVVALTLFCTIVIYSSTRQNEPVLEEDKTVCVLSTEEMYELIGDTLAQMTAFEESPVNAAIYNSISFEIGERSSNGYMVSFDTADVAEIIRNMSDNLSEEEAEQYIISQINNGPRFNKTIEVVAQSWGKNNVELVISNDLKNIFSGDLLEDYEQYADNTQQNPIIENEAEEIAVAEPQPEPQEEPVQVPVEENEEITIAPGGYTGTLEGRVQFGGDNVIYFDDVEMVFSGTERQKELGLYIDTEFEFYNPREVMDEYPLSSDCIFTIVEWNADGCYDKVISKSEFINYNDEWTMVYMDVTDGLVYAVRELFIP